MQRLDWIDQGRGLAVLGVVVVHLSQKLTLPFGLGMLANCGQTGVQLFFLLSAFSMCLSRERRVANVRSFYLRRFFRIAPMYYVALLIYGFIAIVEGAGEAYTPLAVAENFSFTHGLDPRHFNNVVPGGWSIATEMGFYLIFPGFISVTERVSTRSLAISLAVYLAVLGFVEFFFLGKFTYLGENLAGKEFGFVYASLPTQLPVFVLGILMFRTRKVQFRAWSMGIGGLSLLVSFFVLNDHMLDTNADALVYSFAAGFGYFSIAKYAMGRPFQGFFSMWLSSLGKHSYSIYLLHFMGLALTYRLIERLGVSYNLGILEFCAGLIFSLSVTYFASRFTVRFIEDPFVSLGNRISRRWTYSVAAS